MSIEKHRAFIESLEGEKGLPEILYGNRFDAPIESLMDIPKNVKAHDKTGYQYGELPNIIEYLLERCRRAESRQIPDLKEKVKELVRAYVDAERTRTRSAETQREWNEFRALCVPDKCGEVNK